MIGFARTLRAIERANTGFLSWITGAALVLVAAWICWLLFARTTLYVLSDTCRFEASRNPMPVMAPVDGVVTYSELTLGRTIAPGDILFQLDARPFELQRSEVQAQLLAARANFEALNEQLFAEQRAREASASNVRQTSRAAQARVAVAQKTYESKRQEATMVQRLTDESLASRLENIRSRAEADQSSAQATASRAEGRLQVAAGETAVRDREVRIANLVQQLATAQGAVTLAEARIATLTYEIERRTVRGVAEGVLSDVVPLTVGSSLAATTLVATVIPVGDIRVVARFMPQESIGRVLPGQRARVRVDNFPWTQYGTVNAVVTQVGNEPRDGRVRIELAAEASNPSIPVSHGLTGTVEVEVDQLSPLELLLRLSGQKLTPARSIESVRQRDPALQVISNARTP